VKYGPNYVQNIDAEVLAKLPRFCRYDGKARDLAYLDGLVLETATVEQLVYVGERENIIVEFEDGPHRPWKHVQIVELDGAGKPITSGYDNADPIPKLSPDAMSRADLSLLGYTDATLAEAAKQELGEEYEPDGPGPSDLRRSIFTRVMAKVMG
jgi:hypothetical protein